MISSIPNQIPSGPVMAQAVSEHQNHDRQQDIKAHSQSAPDASNDINALQTWFDVLMAQINIEKKDELIEADSQLGDDISKAAISGAIGQQITNSIMAG